MLLDRFVSNKNHPLVYLAIDNFYSDKRSFAFTIEQELSRVARQLDPIYWLQNVPIYNWEWPLVFGRCNFMEHIHLIFLHGFFQWESHHQMLCHHVLTPTWWKPMKTMESLKCYLKWTTAESHYQIGGKFLETKAFIPATYYEANAQLYTYKIVLGSILGTKHAMFCDYQAAVLSLWNTKLLSSLEVKLNAKCSAHLEPALLSYIFHWHMYFWFEQRHISTTSVPPPCLVDHF